MRTLLICAILLAVVAVEAYADLVWDFSDGTLQGWYRSNPSEDYLVVSGEGNPDYCLEAHDVGGNDNTNWAVVPEIYSSDFRAYSTIVYDYYVPDYGEQTSDHPRPKLEGWDGTRYYVPVQTPIVKGAWTTVSIPLDASAWNLNTSTGDLGFYEVLQHVTRFAFSTASNSTGHYLESRIDNVMLVSGMETDVRIEKTGPETTTGVGDTLAYSLTVYNDGPGDATHVVVTDELPHGTEPLSATAGQGECSWDGTTVTCQLGDIAAQSSVVVSVEALVTSISLPNLAFVTTSQFDPNNANDVATVYTYLVETTAVPEYGQHEVVSSLSQNRPNPFNPVTAFTFTISDVASVELRVFDASGRLVRSLSEGTCAAGQHEILWDGRNEAGIRVASGTYFVQMRVGGRVHTRKVVVVK